MVIITDPTQLVDQQVIDVAINLISDCYYHFMEVVMVVDFAHNAIFCFTQRWDSDFIVAVYRDGSSVFGKDYCTPFSKNR